MVPRQVGKIEIRDARRAHRACFHPSYRRHAAALLRRILKCFGTGSGESTPRGVLLLAEEGLRDRRRLATFGFDDEDGCTCAATPGRFGNGLQTLRTFPALLLRR